MGKWLSDVGAVSEVFTSFVKEFSGRYQGLQSRDASTYYRNVNFHHGPKVYLKY